MPLSWYGRGERHLIVAESTVSSRYFNKSKTGLTQSIHIWWESRGNPPVVAPNIASLRKSYKI